VSVVFVVVVVVVVVEQESANTGECCCRKEVGSIMFSMVEGGAKVVSTTVLAYFTVLPLLLKLQISEVLQV
jgi:hypothetical protein